MKVGLFLLKKNFFCLYKVGIRLFQLDISIVLHKNTMISVKCTAQFSYTLFMLNRTVWNRYVTVKLRKLLPGLEKAAWGPNRSMCTDHITQLSHTLSSYKVALDCYVLFFTIVYFYKTTAFTLFFLKKILNLYTDLRLHLKICQLIVKLYLTDNS